MAKKDSSKISNIPTPSSLGQALFQEGASRHFVPDMSGIYKAEAENIALIGEASKEIIKQVKAKKQAVIQPFLDSVDKAIAQIPLETPLGMGLFDLAYDKLTNVKEELKTLTGNDKETTKKRHELDNQVTKLSGSLDKLEKDLINKTALVKTNRWSKEGSDSSIVEAVTHIYNKDRDRIQEEIVGGEIQFTVQTDTHGEVVFMQNEIDEKIIEQQKEIETFITSININAYESGTKKFGKFYLNETSGAIAEKLNTKAIYADITKRILKGQTASVEDAFLDSDVIGKTLERLRSEKDGGKDNNDPTDDVLRFPSGTEIHIGETIDPDEIKNNSDIIFDAVFNLDSDNFNLENNSRIVGDYFGLQAQVGFDDGQRAYQDSLITGNPKNQQILGLYPSMKETSKLFGPEEGWEWGRPGAKIEAYNFFTKKQDVGKVYSGAFGYYVRKEGKEEMYESYPTFKDAQNKTNIKATYGAADILGWEAGITWKKKTGIG